MEKIRLTFLGEKNYISISESVKLWNKKKGNLSAKEFWESLATKMGNSNPSYIYMFGTFDFSELVDKKLKDKFNIFVNSEEFDTYLCGNCCDYL